MPEKTYRLTMPVMVEITVTDEPVGDDPKMHPLDPRRMEGIYDLDDPAEMLSHLAYNAVANGKVCASGLDGWGDVRVLPDESDDWPQWKRVGYVHDHHPVRMRIADVDIFDVDYLDNPPTTGDVQDVA
jgi:hypothetical protein